MRYGARYIDTFRIGQVSSQPGRSEEHTSELQSRRDLVCRLLLEKKKKKKKKKYKKKNKKLIQKYTQQEHTLILHINHQHNTQVDPTHKPPISTIHMLVDNKNNI